MTPNDLNGLEVYLKKSSSISTAASMTKALALFLICVMLIQTVMLYSESQSIGDLVTTVERLLDIDPISTTIQVRDPGDPTQAMNIVITVPNTPKAGAALKYLVMQQYNQFGKWDR